MKKVSILFMLALTFSALGHSQVGVGTVTPNAEFEIASRTNGGGVLIPTYSLTSNTDSSTVTNPTGNPLVVGTLVYNDANTVPTTAVNAIDEGFKYWDGTQWQGLGASTGIMLRTFNSSTSNINSTFNFPSEVYNSIPGTSYNVTTNVLTIPRGVYKLNSNIRMSGGGTADWDVDFLTPGDILGGSIGGSIVASVRTSNSSDSDQTAVFEVISSSTEIRFNRTFSAFSTAVESGKCFMTLEKVN